MVVVVYAGTVNVVGTDVACACCGRGQGVHGAVACKHATRGNLACQRCNFVAVHAFFVVHGNGNSTLRNCIGAVCEGNVVVAVGVTSRNGVGACIGALSLGERYYLRQCLAAYKLQRTFGVVHRQFNKAFAVHACFVVNYNGNGTRGNSVGRRIFNIIHKDGDFVVSYIHHRLHFLPASSDAYCKSFDGCTCIGHVNCDVKLYFFSVVNLGVRLETEVYRVVIVVFNNG